MIKKYNINAQMITEYEAGYDINDAKEKYNLKKIIKLASNENPYGAPPSLIKFLKRQLKNIHLYPDQHYKALLKDLAQKLDLPAGEIFVGNGSDEILDLFFKAFIKPGDKIILFSPSFSLYRILTEIYHAKPIVIKLNDFQYNIDDIILKIKKDIKAVILCNPNNPTGTYLNRDNLIKLIQKLNSKQFLCIDEAYYDFSTAVDFPDTLKLFRKIKNEKNIIVTRTFSKIYSLAGMRIGYAYAKSEFVEILNKIRIPFNINLLAERAVRYSLKNDIFPNKIKILNSSNKYFFYSELKKLKLNYIPSEANFILIKTHIPGRYLFNLLLKKGIIIRPFKDPELKFYIRITVGKPKEIKKLIKELKTILKMTK